MCEPLTILRGTILSTKVRVDVYNSSFLFHDTATTEIYTLSLHDALPICISLRSLSSASSFLRTSSFREIRFSSIRSEEHTSELQSHSDLVCRLLLEKKK